MATRTLEELDRIVMALEGRVAILERRTPTLLPRSLAVDVSAWQAMFDWDRAHIHGVNYALIRSSNGTREFKTGTEDENGRDKWLIRNAYELNRLHIPFSIYHLMQPGDAEEQADLVGDILGELNIRNTPATQAKLSNGRALPLVWCDIEVAGISPEDIKTFYDLTQCGFYSRYSLWNSLMRGITPYWADTACWMAQYGANTGKLPADDNTPVVPYGFKQVDIWQFTSLGARLVGIDSDPPSLDVNLIGPFESAPEPEPEPVKIDLAPYFLPPPGQNFSDIRMLAHSWDGNRERVQVQLDGDLSYTVKGDPGPWELRRIGLDYIDLVKDTSLNATQYYETTGHWTPRKMAVGEEFKQEGVVSIKNKSNCAVAAQSGRFGIERLAQHYDALTLPGGLKYTDVVCLEWVVNGKWDERYYAAAGIGLVQWEKAAADGSVAYRSWAVERIQVGSQGNDKRESGCYS